MLIKPTVDQLSIKEKEEASLLDIKPKLMLQLSSQYKSFICTVQMALASVY